jgi:DNA-binding response OmpR family regulator
VRVLLIDDEKDLVMALAERLGFRGVSADFALQGEEALEMLRTSTYDLVLLDVILPGMPGVEVLREIRREHPGVPVIMISGHGAPVDLPEHKAGGAYDCLGKPIDIDVLVARMQEAIDSK